MSNIPLSTVQEVVERTLWKRVMTEVIDKGYYPNVFDLIAYPKTSAGQAALENAVAAVVTAKGFAINVYSNPAPRDSGEKSLPRFVLISEDMMVGDLGCGTGYNYIRQNLEYKRFRLPPQVMNLTLKIFMVCKNVEQQRILNSILALAVPRRHYIPFYNDPSKNFFIYNSGSPFTMTDRENSILEKAYTYIVPDLFEVEVEDDPNNAIISPLNSVQLDSDFFDTLNIENQA